jgi:hypothetical protein
MTTHRYLQFVSIFLLSCLHVTSAKAIDTNDSNTTDVLTMKWVEPTDQQPVLYEKTEWQITLPEEVSKAIQNWISNDQHRTKFSPAINPFDPDQIDLKAVISYEKNGQRVKQPVFGFFSRNFERVTTAIDPNNWHWKDTGDDISFTIRWAAEVVTGHQVNVSLNVPGMQEWTLPPFHFTPKTAPAKNSFIHISDNKHFFATDDGNIYMPIGLNITEGTFSCSCKEGVGPTENCDECYEWADSDPCCGLNAAKKNRSGIPGTSLKEYTAATAAYLKLEKVLQTLKESGGNSFRTFFDPMVFDIEFEKMNNYYDRQFQAWEFDQLLNVCHDLDLRMELNLQYHYSICYHSYGGDRFDWDDQYNCMKCGEDFRTTGTHGWCYNQECPDVNSPIDFLNNECTLNNYKKKLRYIIARWGYSRNIFMIDLMSEINNIGNGSIYEVDIDTDGDGQKDDNIEHHIQSLYYADPANRLIVANWHHELGRYIKDDLQHRRHPIAADYTGTTTMDADFNGDGDCLDTEIGENCNPCLSKYFDYSWMSPYIDVIAFSNYTGGLNRWERMSNHEYYKNSQSNGLMCGWNNPDTKDDDQGYHSPLGGYESIWKPVVHAENGHTSCMDGDYSGFYKDLFTDAIGGHATGGMSWDEWSETTHWKAFGMISGFLNQNVYRETNPAQGKWRPGHAYSANKTDFKKTKFAETVFQTNPETGYTFGVVMNRSWNFYSTGKGSCLTEDRKNEFRGNDAPLATIHPVSAKTDRIVLNGIARGRYEVRYFNAENQKVIKTTEVRSNGKKLVLEEYPELNGAETSNQPFCFFILVKI